MSVDKLVDSTQLDSDLTSVANAIRAKSGGSGQLAFPAGFVSEIGNIPSGGSTPTVTGLSATYTQSGAVDVTDDLSVLIPDLIVTATIDNTLSVDVASTEYVLSGTFAVGVSTITVTYGGSTATFSVTVTSVWDFYWDYSMCSLPDGWTFSVSGDGSYSLTNDGIELNSGSTTTSYSQMVYGNASSAGGTLVVEASVDKISSDSNGLRICVSDGTNGAQICTCNDYFRLLTSSLNSSSRQLAYVAAGKMYKVMVKFESAGSIHSYAINDLLILENDSTTIAFAASTRIMSHSRYSEKVLIKRIWYKGA